MNNERTIPIEFIENFHVLTWDECLLGIKEQWITIDDVISKAINIVQSGDYSETEFELASLYSYEVDDFYRIIKSLCGNSGSDYCIQNNWMRIIISWVYFNKDKYDNIEAIIEQLYEDFNYPDEIRHLIKYNVDVEKLAVNQSWKNYFLQEIARYVDTCFK